MNNIPISTHLPFSLQTNMNWIGAAIMRITNHMEESWVKLNNGYKQDIYTLEKRIAKLESHALFMSAM